MRIQRDPAAWEMFARSMGYEDMKDLLSDLYVDHAYTTAELGEVLDTNRDGARRLLRRYDIPSNRPHRTEHS